jgi:glycosyltransferase involved in cell wall biosynthesis
MPMEADRRGPRATLSKKLRTARRLLAEEGLGAVAYRAAVRSAETVLRAEVKVEPRHKAPIGLLELGDVLAAEARAAEPRWVRPMSGPPFKVTWVLPPFSAGSGGHANVMRFVRHLEAAGHSCRLAFYDPHGQQSLDDVRRNLVRAFGPVRGQVQQGLVGVEDSDFVFATCWQTAYPVAGLPDGPRTLYFVQDFEPLFHPAGGEYALAERTYSLGMRGITAGRWLETKLTTDYGMPCDHFDFGADADFYRYVPGERRSVFFYARPVTARRGFELGVAALALFARRHPEITIEMAGWNVGNYDLPFPFVNHGVATLKELPAIYGRCAAGLVLSFSNMSLLPLELLAAGCIPVTNEGDNNRMVSDNPHLVYAAPRATDLSEVLCRVVENPDREAEAAAGAASVAALSWDAAGRQLEAVLDRLARE